MQIIGLDMILEATRDSELFREIPRSGGRPLNSPKIKQCFYAVVDALYAEYKEPELTTLDKACVHAAGIAINVYILGADVESIRIHPQGQEFSGMVHYGRFPKPLNFNSIVFREAVTVISGAASEEYMGMGHPASSVFGKFVAAIYSNHLAKATRKEPKHHFQQAFAFAQAVIAVNRHTFNVLVHRLAKTRRISPEEAKAIFKGFRRIPLRPGIATKSHLEGKAK